MMNPIVAVAALASAGLQQAADVVGAGTAPVRRAVAKATDHDAELRRQLLRDREFIAEDGQRYPVGPCGFVPKSARFDPARNRRRFR